MNENIDELKDKLHKCEQLRKLFKAGKEATGKLKEFSEERNAPKNLDQCVKKIAKIKE